MEPPIFPDQYPLVESAVRALARDLKVPQSIVDRTPSAGLWLGQTDEGDLGISYPRADRVLYWLLHGHKPSEIARLGFTEEEVELVERRLAGTHWKRRLPTVAMVSPTAIGESYLRPVDY